MRKDSFVILGSLACILREREKDEILRFAQDDR